MFSDNYVYVTTPMHATHTHTHAHTHTQALDGRDTGFLVRLFAFSQKDGAGILSLIGGTINGDPIST